jgi:hypothetical protein
MKAIMKEQNELKKTIIKQLKEFVNEKLEYVCTETGTNKHEWKYNISQNNEIEFYHQVYGWYVFPIE